MDFKDIQINPFETVRPVDDEVVQSVRLDEVVSQSKDSVNQLKDTIEEMLDGINGVASLILDLTSVKINWRNETEKNEFYRVMENYLDVSKICTKWLGELNVLNRKLSKELDKLEKRD
jgi:hypothetical protein